MNDIDDLRAALRKPPAEPFAEPDLARIMADGTRIRRRRKALSSVAGLAAAAAVVLIVVFAVQLRQPGTVAQPPAASLGTSSASTPASTSETSSPPERRLLGQVVSTGIRTVSGELVIYATEVDDPQVLPDVHFAITAGVRAGDGSLQSMLVSNEFRGSDRSFGFHATDGGEVADGYTIPVFGYFAGPATRITTTVHGKTVEASVTNWTEDPTVVIFWFDPAAVSDSKSLTPLIAYDSGGKRLTK